MIITEHNWRSLRGSEAVRLFPIDSIVQYAHGFTARDDCNFGKVARVTGTGTVFVTKVLLEEVARKPEVSPGDWQFGGWVDFDPKKYALKAGDPLKFMPRLERHFVRDERRGSRLYQHNISWTGALGTGLYDLRPILPDKNGMVRGTYDGFP